MGRVTKVLLLLAVVVPVTGYVAGSLASPGTPPPADHSPVILRDAPTDGPETPAPPEPTSDDRERQAELDAERDRRRDGSGRSGGDKARVVTPQPTAVGEDDDDEWDDDGPDDDDTDDERTDGDD
jgi:hypothetical protein